MGFFKKRKSMTVWVGVNKNGSVSMHTEEPTKNENEGIWTSNSPFVNSVLYKELGGIIEKTKMNWESPAEPFQLNM